MKMKSYTRAAVLSSAALLAAPTVASANSMSGMDGVSSN